MALSEIKVADLNRPLEEVMLKGRYVERGPIEDEQQAIHEASFAVATISRIGSCSLSKEVKIHELNWIKNNVDRVISEVEESPEGKA